MNKLSALVISVFLLLAAAMWYLANASFEQYLNNEISVTGKAATGFDVSSEKIIQAGDELIIASITLSANNKPLVKFNDVRFEVDKKSYKEDVLVITELSITAINTINLTEQTKQELINNLSLYLAKTPVNTSIDDTQMPAHKLPIIAIKQVNIGQDQQKQAISLNSAIMEKGIEARRLFVEIVKLLTTQL